MPLFRLSRRVNDYEHAHLEAESAEEALQLYNEDEGSLDLDWKFDMSDESALIGIDQIKESYGVNESEFVECFEVSEDGKSLIKTA